MSQKTRHNKTKQANEKIKKLVESEILKLKLKEGNNESQD